MVKIGDIIKSQAGHDKDCIYIVYQILSEKYIVVVNGLNKRVLNPKKKNIRHIQIIGNDYEIGQKIKYNNSEIDSQIRKIIKNFRNY